MTLSQLLSILHYPAPIEQAIYLAFRDNFDEISRFSVNSYAEGFPIAGLSPFRRLLAVNYLLLEKHEEYAVLGVPHSIINDTFRDVTLRASRYFAVEKAPGLSENDAIWFRHIINCQIFKVGPLQLQPFKMIYLDEETLGEPYMTFSPVQKVALPAGTPVINCHIPHGADLTLERVTASFIQAKALFSELYPNTCFRAFLCYSWLLYPKMQPLLPETSNIRQFSSRFQIIASCPDTEQAKENIRPNTPLYESFIQNPNHFGFACGINPIQKEDTL